MSHLLNDKGEPRRNMMMRRIVIHVDLLFLLSNVTQHQKAGVSWKGMIVKNMPVIKR